MIIVYTSLNTLVNNIYSRILKSTVSEFRNLTTFLKYPKKYPKW